MELWTLLIPLTVGFGLGYLCSILTRRTKAVGTLRVDRSDPDEASYLFLELEKDGMNEIHKAKAVKFKVDLNGYLARK